MNFCPEWLFDFCVGRCAGDFLAAELPLDAHAKKFARALTELYNEVDPDTVEAGATAILEFLNEINVGADAHDYLTQFCWFTLNYENHRGVKRKRKSMLSTCFDSEKEKTYAPEKAVKAFKAYLYADRSNVLPKMPTGWKIVDEKDIEPLKKMVEQPASVMDML